MLDRLLEVRAPHNPQEATRSFAELFRSYGCTSVIGDRYSARWVQDAYRSFGMSYEVTEQTASDYFAELLPLLNSPGRIELLDGRRLFSQLAQLERRTSRQGRDVISHPPRGHDDVVAAAAIALVHAGRPRMGAFLLPVEGF